MTDSTRNNQIKGKVSEGNNVKYFEKLASIVSVNDGKRKCGDSIIQATNSQPPFDSKNKTQVTVATTDFDVTNIDKSSAIIDVTCRVSIDGLNANIVANDPDHLLKLFVGFKSSNQIFRETNTTSLGREVGYHSNSLQYEGFVYANSKCDNEVKRKRGIFTTYKNVFNYDQSVCGTYVNLVDFADGAVHDVRFQLNIPFTNLLMFSFFGYMGKFPSFIANIILKDLYTSPDALVFALCSPEQVRFNKVYLQGDVLTGTYGDLSQIVYEHRFHQVKDPSVLPSAGTAVGVYTSSKVRVNCSSMRIDEFKSHIKGYMINDNAKQIISQQLQREAICFPSQECFYYGFNNKPTANGLLAQNNISLFNTTSICVGYPKTANEITCLQNPMQVAVRLKVDNVYIPNEGYDTTGITHLQDQIGINNLDGSLNPSRDFENSIISAQNNPDTGARYANCLADDTSYIPEFQTERSDGGYVVDGINTNGQNISIQLEGKPKHSGINDTYFIPDIDDPSIHPPEPFMLECRDTYFVLGIDAVGQGFLKYFNDRVPYGSQA
jgi:hypothetical protein